MEQLRKEVGKRIAEIRKSKNLKQEDLKELLDAPTVQMISGWENGHSFPSASYLIILAKKLDISLDYLLLGKESNTRSKKISTYKDIAERMVELENTGLFKIESHLIRIYNFETDVLTEDKTVYDFKCEYSNLLGASKSLRPELFDQAIIDLLNKYDFPIKPNKNENSK